MEAEKIVQISPLVRRITAGNGSVFTGPGTNTYLVGNEDVTVIDPGPAMQDHIDAITACLLYTSPSPRDGLLSRMPSSA